MSFLPKDYEVPQAQSNYMKFQNGINRFRILGSAIVGFEYFTNQNKPVRSIEPFETTPEDIKKGGVVKAFWAFPVWNYQASKDKDGKWIGAVQILELTQKTIMNAIKNIVDNPKWGSPMMYDIAITKTGEGMETEYQTQAEPPIEETAEEIKQAFEEKNINLNALFDGQNPFEK